MRPPFVTAVGMPTPTRPTSSGAWPAGTSYPHRVDTLARQVHRRPTLGSQDHDVKTSTCLRHEGVSVEALCESLHKPIPRKPAT
jgi:hypothetical protein